MIENQNTRRGFTQINWVGQAPGVRVDNSRATRLETCNLLGTARGAISVVGQALPDNAPVKGHLAAFTLIELLVVVLIIGILAAVALPQYQKSVKKSRVATMLPVLSSLVQAQEAYYLANGQYTSDGRKLDVETGCSELENTDGKFWKCGNDFLVNVEENGMVGASYCPKNNSSYEVCKPVREFQLGFAAPHTTSNNLVPNAHYCWAPNGSTEASEEICKALGEPVDCKKGTRLCYELY